MKHHVVVKLHRPVAEPVAIPEWRQFITDKAVEVTSLLAPVDRVLHAAGREFWVTHEYAPAGTGWNDVERHHGLDRTYRLVFVDGTQRLPDSVLAELARIPEVADCHQLEVAHTPLPDDDDLVRPQSRDAEGRDLIGLGFAHALTRGRPDVRVAVLDTGADLDHPEIRDKIVARADFVDLTGLDTSSFVGDYLDADGLPMDELGHGTHVAGIIAAEGSRMPVGLAPGCRLMAVRVLATLRTGDTVQGAGIVDNINPAIKWATDAGADVINMSLGIRHTGGGLPHEDVIRYAVTRGVTVVAASGNDGTDTKYYPGALPGVLAVGAVDDAGAVAGFTSYGAPISVVAPGVGILSSYSHGRYAVASGTSQAAPMVAGAVALLKSYSRDRGRDLDADQVVRLLRETSDRVDSQPRSRQAGFGLINLTDAFKWLLSSLN